MNYLKTKKLNQFLRDFDNFSNELFKGDYIKNISYFANERGNKFGLLTGISGHLYYYKSQPKTEILESIINWELEKVKPFFDFSSGIGGMMYLLNQLDSVQFDKESKSIVDNLLLNFSLTCNKYNHWDFLAGSIGIANSLLEYDKLLGTKICEDIITMLNKNKIVNDDGTICWNSKLYPNEINFGMAHGLVTIVQFLNKCVERNIRDKESREMLQNLTNYIINQKIDINIYGSIIPGSKSISTSIYQGSRLAWCYGDLSTAYALFRSGEVLRSPILISESIKLLDSTLKRIQPSETFIEDASICHGSIGVAYLYYKFYKKTSKMIYLQKASYWLDYSFQFSTFTNGICGFKFYDRFNNIFINDISILEGITGIAFVVRSILEEDDTEWDTCLLLS